MEKNRPRFAQDRKKSFFRPRRLLNVATHHRRRWGFWGQVAKKMILRRFSVGGAFFLCRSLPPKSASLVFATARGLTGKKRGKKAVKPHLYSRRSVRRRSREPFCIEAERATKEPRSRSVFEGKRAQRAVQPAPLCISKGLRMG